MAMAKRVFLFMGVNILVILTISITMNLLGVRPYLSANGINYQSLLIFCACFGFGGAFISLLISRWMAKKTMGVQVIDPQNPQSGAERDLYQMVQRLSQKAGISTMPEVGIYPSPEVNAFATGPSKNKALVAVSQGLLNQMDSAAVEGVVGHEIAHVANGDMVTMTLIQGVVNTFVMFFARIAAWGVSQALRGDRDEGPSPIIHFVTIIAFEILFSILGSIVVAFFSRWREFRADLGGANFAGKDKMIHALESLKSSSQMVDPGNEAIASLKISGLKKGGIAALLATHPDLDVRIEALKNARTY